ERSLPAGHVGEGLPETAGRTEPTAATVIGTRFDLDGKRPGPDPAASVANPTQMQMAIAGANLALPLLPVQIEIGRRSGLGVELGGRELFGDPSDLRGASDPF